MFRKGLQTEQIVVLNIDVGDSGTIVHSEPLLVPSDYRLSLFTTQHVLINHADFLKESIPKCISM